jgi:hypothetical protein
MRNQGKATQQVRICCDLLDRVARIAAQDKRTIRGQIELFIEAGIKTAPQMETRKGATR